MNSPIPLQCIDLKHLEQALTGMCIVNSERQIVWVNARLAGWVGISKSDLQGKALDEPPLNSLLADEPTVFMVSVDGQEFRLKRQEIALDKEQTLILFQDVTREEIVLDANNRLSQQVEELKLTDDLTGLPNQRAARQMLDMQISRSRRYQNPLSVVMVITELAESPSSNEIRDRMVLAVSRYLRDRMRWVDQVARWDDNVFMLVLPETQEQDAKQLIAKLKREKNALPLPVDIDAPSPNLIFGLSCWQKGDDMRTLLRSVVEDLKSAA